MGYASVGRSDLMGSSCTMSFEDLTDTIELAIKNIVTNIKLDVSQYFLTVYYMRYKREEEAVGYKNPSIIVAVEYTMAIIHTKNTTLSML